MKILFIGNSYTYYNEMPLTFENVCRSKGLDVTAEQVTCGGYTLSSYLDVSDIYGRDIDFRLKTVKYDFVVLQEQSIRPASEPERFFAAARILCDKIKENGAKILFYETWGRRDGHEVLIKHGWTSEEMQARIKVSYENLAAETGGHVVLAGDALHRAYRGDMGDRVFKPDGSHPSEIGSALVADAFFAAIFPEYA